jgi:hypothetical protein
MESVPVTTRLWPRPGRTVLNQFTGGPFTFEGYDIPYITREIQLAIDVGDLLKTDPGVMPPTPDPSSLTDSFLAYVTQGLRLLRGVQYGYTAIAHGRSTGGDGGYGQFFWDAASSDAEDGGLTLGNSPYGRWRRLVHKSFINVKWFGAKGDGVTDDTAAIQAAINAASGLFAPSIYPGCDVYVPPGQYIISSTIGCHRAAGCEGLRIYGSNTPGSYVASCTFLWNGTSYIAADPSTRVPMFWSSGNDFSFANLTIRSSSFKNLYSGIEVGSPSVSSISITHNKFNGLTVQGDSNSHVNAGVTMGSLFPQNGNLENFVFEDCVFDSMQGPAVTPGHGVVIVSGQPFNTSFLRCHFSDSLGGMKCMRGVISIAASSSITMTDCDFQSLEAAVVSSQSSANISINGGEAENCKKIFYGAHFAVGVSGSFSVKNMRLSPAQINTATYSFAGSDHAYILSQNGGGVTVENCYFTNGPVDTTNIPLISVNQGCPLRVHNCDFANSTPFVALADDRGLTAGFFASANRYYVGDNTEMVPLQTYTGGVNPSGTATISGAATTATVTLPRSELDTSYRVRLDVDSITSGGTVGAVWPSAFTATSFVVNVSAAPGASKNLVVRYTIVR